jgi:hypothetical protein
VSQFIASLHNAWLQLDPGVRAALSFSAAVLLAAAIGLTQAFAWFVPASVVDAKGEVIAFLAYALPVLAVLVAQLVRSKIAPALVGWFLRTFGYITARQAGYEPLVGGALGNLSAWVKAA